MVGNPSYGKSPMMGASPPEVQAFADEMARRDAANPNRCVGCGGAHGKVWFCGGCEETEENCHCGPTIPDDGGLLELKMGRWVKTKVKT